MNPQFDDLRAREFTRLDSAKHVYLDYTGGGLYAESQIRAHSELLLKEVFGNPHSHNPTSLASTHNVEAARQRIRQFFNANSTEYEVIFTLNASGALKLIGESYPWSASSHFFLTADNHNSVNGIREFAQSHGASIKYLPLNRDLRTQNIESLLPDADRTHANLFAFPAQSNFSGVKHPLEWIELAHSKGYDVLLDAAAYVPTNDLDLGAIHPDFTSISFYKMFGFPTGVGALIIRKEVMHRLQRPWFGGGTVRFVSAQNNTRLLANSGEAFEDGTLNYLSIAAIPNGLDFLNSVGIENINHHVMTLTEYMLYGILNLYHSNGHPLVQLYGPRETTMRGGTIAFNITTPDGRLIEMSVIEERANARNISVRTGCFCNPGAAEFAFDYLPEEAYHCFTTLDPDQFTIRQFSTCMNNLPVGAIRASVGIASNQHDLDELVNLVASFKDFVPEAGQTWRLPQLEMR